MCLLMIVDSFISHLQENIHKVRESWSSMRNVCLRVPYNYNMAPRLATRPGPGPAAPRQEVKTAGGDVRREREDVVDDDDNNKFVAVSIFRMVLVLLMMFRRLQ